MRVLGSALVVGMFLLLILLVVVLTGCNETSLPEPAPASVASCPSSDDGAVEPDGEQWEGLPDGFEAGSIRSDIEGASYRVGEASRETENAARWGAIILARFYKSGLTITFGKRELFPIHIRLGEETKVEVEK